MLTTQEIKEMEECEIRDLIEALEDELDSRDTPNNNLSGGEAVRSDALLDDIHDALMDCPSNDDGDAYPESMLITLGDAWAVLERYRKSSNARPHAEAVADSVQADVRREVEHG